MLETINWYIKKLLLGLVCLAVAFLVVHWLTGGLPEILEGPPSCYNVDTGTGCEGSE